MPPKRNTCCDCGGSIWHGSRRCAACHHRYDTGRRHTDFPEPNPSGLCMCGCGQHTPLAKTTTRRQGNVGGKPQRFVFGHQAPRPRKHGYTVDPETGCWNWTGPLDRDGYGSISVGGVLRHAHRALWIELRGPLPRELVLDHAVCQNRQCVNPDHMEPVPSAVNSRRSPRVAKLNVEQVREIRRRLTSERSVDLAREFGVAKTTICSIKHRRNWRDV
jgi:hypothetical protein